MLDTSVAAQRFLVGARVEEADVLGFIDQFGQEDRIRVGFAVVEIFAVAGEPPEEYALVLQIPMVDGQQDVALFNAPYVGQRGHERTVDHVPPLAVVLLVLVDDREERGAAFAHGKRSEFGKNVRFGDSGLFAEVLDLGYDLFGHILVIVIERERVFDRKAAADIQRIEFGADLLQFVIDTEALVQLVPVIGCIFDAGVDEKVQHLQLELLVRFDPGLVELDDVVVADAEPRGVEIEFRLLFGCDADTDLARFVDCVVEQVQFAFVVENRNGVLEAVVDQRRYIFDILRPFEPVADDVDIFVDNPAVVQCVDDVDVVSRRGLEVDIVLANFSCSSNSYKNPGSRPSPLLR